MQFDGYLLLESDMESAVSNARAVDAVILVVGYTHEKELKAFARVPVDSGESRAVAIDIKDNAGSSEEIPMQSGGLKNCPPGWLIMPNKGFQDHARV